MKKMAKPIWVSIEAADRPLEKKSRPIKLRPGQTFTVGTYSQKDGSRPLASMHRYLREAVRLNLLRTDEMGSHQEYSTILEHQSRAALMMGKFAQFRAGTVKFLASHGFRGALRTSHLAAATDNPRKDERDEAHGIHLIGTHTGDFLYLNFLGSAKHFSPKKSESRHEQNPDTVWIPIAEIKKQTPGEQSHKFHLPNGVVVHFYENKPNRFK